MRRDSGSVAVVKSVTNFSAAFKKKHGVFFLAAWMVDFVEDMVSSKFVTSNSSQTHQRHILAAKFLLQRPNFLIISEKKDREEP